jgi:hypothetical protein
MPDELDRLLRRMRLPYLRRSAPDVMATARAQRWDPAEVLRVLIHEEVVGRDAATRRIRRESASFPTGKTHASWRARQIIHPRSHPERVTTLEWVHRHETMPSPERQAPVCRTSSKYWRTRRRSSTRHAEWSTAGGRHQRLTQHRPGSR